MGLVVYAFGASDSERNKAEFYLQGVGGVPIWDSGLSTNIHLLLDIGMENQSENRNPKFFLRNFFTLVVRILKTKDPYTISISKQYKGLYGLYWNCLLS